MLKFLRWLTATIALEGIVLSIALLLILWILGQSGQSSDRYPSLNG